MKRSIFDGETTPRVAVSLLAGFLGSGKTTLLNAMLTAPDMRDAAVIINEFGNIPIDQYFVDLPKDDIAILPNGCLCCIARDGLEEALTRVLNTPRAGRGPLSRIVIETSGLADPAPVAQLIRHMPSPVGLLELDKIIVTVDAEHLPAQLARHAECRKQIAFADVLIFTKADRLQVGAIDAARPLAARYNATAIHYLGRNGEQVAAPSLPVDRFAHDAHDHYPARGAAHEHDDTCDHSVDITSVTLTQSEAIEWSAFSRWFRQLRHRQGDAILRVKGVLNIAGFERPVAVDAIHHIAYPARHMPASFIGDGTSRLVFILQGLAAEIIEQSWADFRLARTVTGVAA